MFLTQSARPHVQFPTPGTNSQKSHCFMQPPPDPPPLTWMPSESQHSTPTVKHLSNSFQTPDISFMPRKTLSRTSKLRAEQAIANIANQVEPWRRMMDLATQTLSGWPANPDKDKEKEKEKLGLVTTRLDLVQQKVFLRIQRDFWNSIPCSIVPKQKAPKKLILKLRVPPSKLPISDPTPKARTWCNIKVWSFQYGGPDNAQKGKMSTQVTLKQPCLQNTCPNCRKWFPGLVDEDFSPFPIRGWNPGEGNGLEPMLPSLEESIHVVRLRFQTDVARQNLADILGRPGKGTALRSILKGSEKRKREGGYGNGEKPASLRKKVRFRHRVKCVFVSEEGKEMFRRYIEGLDHRLVSNCGVVDDQPTYSLNVEECVGRF